MLDLARRASDGRLVFLRGQSYMPAQDLHVLRNPRAAEHDPWYEVDDGAVLITPEWRFAWRALRRFADD